MSILAFERLQKILALEEKQGCRNRAVVGGMQAMGKRWATDAQKENADSQIISAVVSLMECYAEADGATRLTFIAQMRQALIGDLEAELVEDLAASSASRSKDGQETRADVQTHQQRKPSQQKRQKKTVPNRDEPFESAIPPAELTHIAKERVRKKKAQANRNPHDLQASVQILPGIGDAASQQLARLGIEKVIDLMWHLPTRYEDYSQLRTISELQSGEQATIIANLWEVNDRKISMNRQIVQGILADASGTLHATWWNKYVKKQLTPGTTMRFSGKVGFYMGQKTLDNPAFEDLDQEMVATGRLSPVYRLTEGLSNKHLHNLIKTVLDDYAHFLSDPLPSSIRTKYELPELTIALQQIHFPDDQKQRELAQRRLIFEEFFYIQIGVLQRRQVMQQGTAFALPSSDEMVTQFTSSLAFQLTNAQARVLDEVRLDLARKVPMTRLVQGDVGSGKTVVAAAAMYIAAANETQSALLAPTQILAEQHHRSISTLVESLVNANGEPIQVALLTGRMTGSDRASVLEGLRNGTIDIVVGTTALIQDRVEFNRLGLAIVDEQHRFGVIQRGALRSGQNCPHLLVMSATPIPRSLAMTIYGDLDLSIINEMPPGRTPIKTRWFLPTERERLYAFMRCEVEAGRQGFIVYPLVEESDKLDVGAAIDEYERLRKEIFFKERVALLHGRMSGTEKDAVMQAFADHEYDILVSTSVIEVGIDVPNASLIIIENAERFGLAQLHQFRGRVGRGQHASYCALLSKGTSFDAEERLTALEESNDGFILAEKDLELRGPGDFFGTRQSGLPELRVAQLSDLATLSQARKAAQELFDQDPRRLREHPQLSRQVDRFWRGHGDVS